MLDMTSNDNNIVEGIGNEVLWSVSGIIGVTLGSYFMFQRFQTTRMSIDRQNQEFSSSQVARLSNRLIGDNESDTTSPIPHYGSDQQCPVCLTEFRYPVETNCGHLFCAQCLISYWRLGNWMGAIRCPVCRQPVFDSGMDETFNISDSDVLTNNSTRPSTPTYTFGVLGPEYHSQVRICLLTLMIAFSLIGNSIMCIHISQHRRRNHRIQLLFVNLALADFLVTCFTMTSQLVWECMGKEWIGGETFCPIFKVLQTFTMVCSNYLIVTIALDRHFAIAYPLKRSVNTRFYLVSAWLVSLLPSLPNAYIFQVYKSSDGNVFCVAKFYTSSLSLQVRQFYMAFVFLSVFILPIFIVVALYTRILFVIWTRTHAFPGHMASAESISSNSTSKEQSGIHSRYPRAKIKTLRMTLVVVVTFLATSLPYLVQEMIIAFGDPSSLNENVVAMAGIFSASNSTINPYVYLLFNAKALVAKRVSNSLCSCCLPSQKKNGSAAEL